MQRFMNLPSGAKLLVCATPRAHLRHKSLQRSPLVMIFLFLYSSRLPLWQISRSISVSGFVRLRRDAFAAGFAFCFCRGAGRMRENTLTGESPAEQANIDWRRRKSRGAAREQREPPLQVRAPEQVACKVNIRRGSVR